MTPYVDKVYKHSLSQSHIAHHGVINCFVDLAKRMGKRVKVVPEDELKLENEEERLKLMDGVDLVVSMGGDHTFLKSQALLQAQDIPIIGINTNRDVFEGALNTEWIDFGKKEEHAMNLLESIEDDGGVVYEKRSRLLFERQPTNKHNNLKRTFCLNETLCAERDVSSASRYKVKRDGKDIGLFKSSGLIISTGTGSTGWLYSVRQITPD